MLQGSLHHHLVEAAMRDGVAVDDFVTMALAQAVGAQQAAADAAMHTLYRLSERQLTQVAERLAETTRGDRQGDLP